MRYQHPEILPQVPEAVFNEFALHDADECQREFELRGASRGKLYVSLSPAQIVHPERPCTLVLRDFRCDHGVFNRQTLSVHPDRLALADVSLSPVHSGRTSLFVAVYGDSGPRRDAEWRKGHGYWIQEYCSIETPWQSFGWSARPRGEERQFLEQLATLARELELRVTRRGHWQREWNPAGNFGNRAGARDYS
jgi:hypothetical protein